MLVADELQARLADCHRGRGAGEDCEGRGLFQDLGRLGSGQDCSRGAPGRSDPEARRRPAE
eukprot:1726396-Alexandrium_andersonii.AAC.1